MAIQKEWNLNVPHCGRANKNRSIFTLVINQLDAQNVCFTVSLFHASTCFEHHVLIIRRSELHYTASGISSSIAKCYYFYVLLTVRLSIILAINQINHLLMMSTTELETCKGI
jgi:uncharacterized membrane protein